MHKLLFYNKFIIFLYMFRALLCSSSGGQNFITQHLVSSHSVGDRPVRTCYCLLAGTSFLLGSSSSICLTKACCSMYSLELLLMDGKTVRNM